MRFFTGYLIEGDAADYYKKLTEDLASRFGIDNLNEHIPPHFTFKPPFDTSNIEEFEKMIEVLSKELKVQKIVIKGFERFDFESPTIFLNAQEDQELMIAIKKIVTTLKEYGENRNFLPDPFRLHASVARYLSKDQSDEIWSYLQTIPQPSFTLNFDNLTIFSKNGNKWEVYRTYRFDDFLT